MHSGNNLLEQVQSNDIKDEEIIRTKFEPQKPGVKVDVM